jgi:hypothetical protein
MSELIDEPTVPSRRQPGVNTQSTQKPQTPIGGRRNVNSLFGMAMSGNRQSADMGEIHESFSTLCTGYYNATGVTIEAIAFDDISLLIPAEMLVVREGNRLYVGVFLISHLLRSPIPDFVEGGVYGREIVLPQTEESLWTSPLMRERAFSLLSRTFFSDKNYSMAELEKQIVIASVQRLSPSKRYITTGDCEVPFDHAMASILAYIKLARGEGTSLFTADDLRSAGYSMMVRHKINPTGMSVNTYGEPMACDIELTLVARSQKRADSLHQSEVDQIICQVSLTIDFLPMKPGSEVVRLSNRLEYHPLVVPIFIIRQATTVSLGTTNNDSFLTQILALSMVKAYSEDPQRWGQLFEPGAMSNCINNIGLLGKLGDPNPSSNEIPGVITILPRGSYSTEPKSKTVLQVIEQYCSSTPIIAMDIVRAGPMQGLQELFTYTDAENLLNTELSSFVMEYNETTQTHEIDKDAFFKFWHGEFGGPIKAPIFDPNHDLSGHVDQYEGTFVGSDNQLHDINEVDLLAFLYDDSVSEETLVKYANCSVPSDNSMIDLDNRYQLITGILPHATITGKSMRYFFNPHLLFVIDRYLTSYGVGFELDENMLHVRSSFGLNRDYLLEGNEHSSAFRSAGIRRGDTRGNEQFQPINPRKKFY